MNPIVTQASDADLVPFVGAGASQALRDRRTGRPALPTWREFLLRAAERLANGPAEDVRSAVTENRLPQAASIIRRELSAKSSWHKLLRDSFDIRREHIIDDDLRLQRAIWRASRGLVVTTNYDESLAWTAPKPSVNTYGLEAGVDMKRLNTATTDRPVLWHLHGRIQFPGSIVLAAEDYEDLYDRQEQDRYKAALFSFSTLATLRSLLFIGFSLYDEAIVTRLREMHTIFKDSDLSHYLVCRSAEEHELRERIREFELENLELIVVEDFGEPVLRVLEQLREPPHAPPRRVVSRPPTTSIRRRCRTIVAGSPEFISRMRPMLAEHRPSEASLLLEDIVEDASPGSFESAIARAAKHEFQGRFERMIEAASWVGEDPQETANCRLFRGIGLEKSNQLDEAVAEYERILRSVSERSELHLCADFNTAVCREKDLDDEADLFAKYIELRDLRLSSGEWVWTKAFNMELIRCTRRNLEFRFGGLLDEAIQAEIWDASTGFAKTIVNWAKYKGEPLPPEYEQQVELVARRAPVTVRVPMLDYLQATIDDPSLSKALNDALDAAGRSADLLRLVETQLNE